MASTALRITRPSLWRTVGIVLAAAMWLWLCGTALVSDMAQPGKFASVVLAALMLLPVVALKLDRVPIYLLATYAALIPFSTLVATDRGLTYMKLLGIATGMAFAFYLLATRRVATPSKSLVVVLVLTAYMATTIFWSQDPQTAAVQFTAYLALIALFALVSLYPAKPADMTVILIATVAGATAAAFYAGDLFLHGQHIANERVYIRWVDNRGIDPNVFASLLLVPIALALMMFLRERLNAAKLVWLGTLTILLFGFAVSGSRGAAIGLAAMIVYFAFRSPYKRQLIAIIVVLAFAVLASPIAQRFMHADVTNGDGRFDVWRIGAASLRQYWLFGAGIGNFNHAFMQYFLTVPHRPAPWNRVAHSIIVGGVVELGLPGLLLLLAVWWTQFRDLAHVRANAAVNDVCIALQGGVLGLFVAGLSLSLMAEKYTWMAFSLVALMRSMLVGSGVSVEAPAPRAVSAASTS